MIGLPIEIYYPAFTKIEVTGRIPEFFGEVRISYGKKTLYRGNCRSNRGNT